MGSRWELGDGNHEITYVFRLNHFGFLFGGYLLKFTDEIAWIAATMEFPGYRFVTIGMDRVEFRKEVADGTILKITCDQARKGNTSVTFDVSVVDAKALAGDTLFETSVTLVSVDDAGKKCPI